MSEIVEKVAAAMRERDRARSGGRPMKGWGDASDTTKAKFRDYAKAALGELHQSVTPDMAQAASDRLNIWGIGATECRQIFDEMMRQAMLHARPR